MDVQKILTGIILAGMLIALFFYRAKIQSFLTEVLVELKKVSWPTKKELFDYLAGLGYEMFYFNEGVHVRGQKLAEGDLMKWKHFDIHALPS